MSTSPRSAKSKLTAPQRMLLSNLHCTDYGALCLRGRDLRMGDRLADLGLARRSPGSRWYEITPAGRELHLALWEEEHGG